jgi:putative ABC transport system permease protein
MMQLSQGLLSSFQQLLAHPLRTVLTLSGIAIGVASLLSMVGVGEGARRQVIADMERLGGAGLIIVEAPNPMQVNAKQVQKHRQLYLDDKDVRAIRTASRHIEQVAPVGIFPASFAHAARSFDGQLMGITPAYASIRGWRVAAGRFLIASDMTEERKICVLGAEVKTALFKQSEAVGRQMKIGQEYYTIVGIMAHREFEAGRWMNGLVLIPLPTFEHRLVRTDRFSKILVKTDATQSVPVVQSQIQRVLTKHYGRGLLFKIHSQAEVIESVNQSTMLLRLSLGVSSLIVLLVGGIGIMNLMLVSVTERTREIGLRKAVGATALDVLSQFLMEAVIVSAIGGGIGIIAGLVMARASSEFIALVLNQTIRSVISLKAILVAVVFIFLVGVFFGLYPAIRAARLDPSKALSYE